MNPYSLPSGWRWVKLGDICKIDSNQVDPNSSLARKLPYIGLEHVESGTGRIVNDIQDKYGNIIQSNTFRFDSKHVLYGKLRPYLNKVVIPEFEGRCTTELLPLLPIESCDRIFLAWLLRRPETIQEAMQNKTGSRMPRADMKELFEMEVPFPPLPEQRRIAAKIQELMQELEYGRAACKKQLEAAQALQSAYLRSVFESEEAKQWERKSLKEVCDKPEYGYTTSAENNAIGPKFLRISDIQDGKVDWNKVPYCRCDREVEKYLLKSGDILFARTGATTGKSYLIQEEPPRAIFASYLIRIRPKDTLLPEYLHLFLQSSSYWNQVASSKRGGAQPNMNATLLSKVILPLPSFPVQRRIISLFLKKFACNENILKSIKKQHALIDAFPQVILAKAFRGNL